MTLTSENAWPIETDNQVEALARECDWDNRKYMTPKDYAIWCERMRKFARLAALSVPAAAVVGEPIGYVNADYKKELDCYDTAVLHPNDRSTKHFPMIPVYASTSDLEAVRIGDEVLSWMVKYDLLDAGNEYRAEDVLSVLNDLAPYAAPSAPDGWREALRLVIEYDDLLRHWEGPEQVLLAGDVEEIDAAYDKMVASCRTALQEGSR